MLPGGRGGQRRLDVRVQWERHRHRQGPGRRVPKSPARRTRHRSAVDGRRVPAAGPAPRSPTAALGGFRRRRPTPGAPVRAALDRFEFPGTDPAVRARLESELATAGAANLHARLEAVDPASATTIEATNGRRIVRALEVVEITGPPYRASLPGHEYAYDHVVAIGLDVPRPELDRRIAARVDAMWRAGLIDEVRALEAAGLRTAPTASRALGYAQVLRLLAGELTEREALEDTVPTSPPSGPMEARAATADRAATRLRRCGRARRSAMDPPGSGIPVALPVVLPVPLPRSDRLNHPVGLVTQVGSSKASQLMRGYDGTTVPAGGRTAWSR